MFQKIIITLLTSGHYFGLAVHYVNNAAPQSAGSSVHLHKVAAWLPGWLAGWLTPPRLHLWTGCSELGQSWTVVKTPQLTLSIALKFRKILNLSAGPGQTGQIVLISSPLAG